MQASATGSDSPRKVGIPLQCQHRLREGPSGQTLRKKDVDMILEE
jgi:hypothetical protein